MLLLIRIKQKLVEMELGKMILKDPPTSLCTKFQQPHQTIENSHNIPFT